MPRQDPGHNGQHTFASFIHSVVFTSLILNQFQQQTTSQAPLCVTSLKQRLSRLAFETRQPVLELRLCPPIRGWRDQARLVRATEFRKGFTHNPKCVPRLSNFVLKVDGELFVSLVSLTRIPQHAFPKPSCNLRIPVALGEPCQCGTGSTVRFQWQRGSDRLF